MDPELIQFNVGGTLFPTTKSTLGKHPDTLLNKLATTSVGVLKDKDGNILIDRNPKYFNYILDYYRLGSESISELPENEKIIQNLKREYGYFGLIYPKKALDFDLKVLVCHWRTWHPYSYDDEGSRIHFECQIKINKHHLFHIKILFNHSYNFDCICGIKDLYNERRLYYVDDKNNNQCILDVTETEMKDITKIFGFGNQSIYKSDIIIFASYLMKKALAKKEYNIEKLLGSDIEHVK